MKLYSLPSDKANHVVYGAVIAAIINLVYPGHALISMAAVAAIGATKEAIDWWGNRKAAKAGLAPPHGVEYQDLIATIVGGLLANSANF